MFIRIISSMLAKARAKVQRRQNALTEAQQDVEGLEKKVIGILGPERIIAILGPEQTVGILGVSEATKAVERLGR